MQGPVAPMNVSNESLSTDIHIHTYTNMPPDGDKREGDLPIEVSKTTLKCRATELSYPRADPRRKSVFYFHQRRHQLF